jgi:Asp-tRNA(Asn)/Glu-tRNA(Gln) amidotransferase A subunit family amidase
MVAPHRRRRQAVSRTSQLQARSYFAATAAFAEGTDSPRAFLDRCIETIEELDPKIGAFVAINFDGARAAADAATERWRAGKTLSSIDGMPVGIKDIMETADMVTEQGSPLFVGWRGKRDAAAVAALREAGAVIVGKTVTTEFASTEPRGTRNPWDLERTPGGSSSGSAAAVASGMLPAALGTQVIGSIVRPSSFCGVFGYKPSVGGINRGGSFDEFSQSCSGVLAATLGEAWTVAREITARCGGDPGYTGVLGPMALPTAELPKRIALLYTAGWDRASDEAKQALLAARQQLSATGIEVVDRTTDPSVEAAEGAIAGAHTLSMRINAWEGHWPLNTYARDMDRSALSAGSLDRLTTGGAITQEEYQGLIGERERIREAYAALQQRVALCVTLSATGPAPIGLGSTGDPIFAVPSSLLGVPALSLPVLQAQGLPLGLQLLGFTNQDAALFASAAALLPIVTPH